MALNRLLRLEGRVRVPSLLFVFFLSLLLGGVNFFFFSKLPEFKAPIPGSDTALYWFLGELAKERGLLFSDFNSYFFSPVYAYLFFIFSFLGNSVSVASLFSLGCFILSALLVFLVTELLFEDTTLAFIASFLFVLCKPIEFYSFLPMKTMFFILLLLLFLYCVLKSLRSSSQFLFFLSGFVAGIALEVEGLFLPILIVVLSYLFLKKELKLGKFFFVFIGMLVALTPFSLRNFLVAGSLNPISPLSGIHLYIGNNPKATGIYRSVSGIRPNAFGHYFDAKKVAEREEGRSLSDGEVNAFWRNKALLFVKENPEKFALLFLRKLLLSVNDFEIPNNFNMYVISQHIPPLKFNPLRFSVFFSLGVAGALLLLLKERRLNFMLVLLILYPFIISLFFITSRYRVIWIVFLVPFVAYLLGNFRWVLESYLRVLFLLVTVSSLFLLSKQDLFPLQKRIMEKSYAKRAFYAKLLTDINEKLRKGVSERERKKLLLKEARLFYIARMGEIGNFLREKALRK